MLTKDTLHFISRKIDRSLTGVFQPDAKGKAPGYRIHVPQDKLDLLVGATLDERYYVLSLVGKGGMSLVYKAKDLKTDEIVAVKCLRTQVLGDETMVKRFKREADVLKRLNHPRIVQFYAYGTSKSGLPYFVMDYLIGTSLGAILRRQGPLDLGRFQDIFVQVAAAIGHAHKHGAVHRDIKPGNIMLIKRAGTADYVKIVDFGIAKVKEGTSRLTRLGEVWGSPIYMSPEQCMGTNIDLRTDIYSLGIVMYEALTGEVPFLGRNYADTMTKQISEEPPTFKAVAPEKKIPETLEQIVFKAISKKPDERYQSMADLKRDLERALDARSIEVKQSGVSFIKSQSGELTQPTVRQPFYDTLDVTSEKLPTIPLDRKLEITSYKLSVVPETRLTRGNEAREKPPLPTDDDHAYFGTPIELTGPNIISASKTEHAGFGNRSERSRLDRKRTENRSTSGRLDQARTDNAKTANGSPRASTTGGTIAGRPVRATGERKRGISGEQSQSVSQVRKKRTISRNRMDSAKPQEKNMRETQGAGKPASQAERSSRTRSVTKKANQLLLKFAVGLLIISLVVGMVFMSFVQPVIVKKWLLENFHVSDPE